jgi:hypothetical protein
MPSISIAENINGLNKNLQQIRHQTREAEAEAYRIEGMIRVFKSMHDVGILEIPLPEPKTLENTSEEVIDDASAVHEIESKQE